MAPTGIGHGLGVWENLPSLAEFWRHDTPSVEVMVRYPLCRSCDCCLGHSSCAALGVSLSYMCATCDAFLSEDLSITYISAASSDGAADTGAMSSLKMLKLARLGRILASQWTKKVPGYQWWCGCGVCATPPLCALLKINFAFEDKWLSLQRSWVSHRQWLFENTASVCSLMLSYVLLQIQLVPL